MTKVKDERRKEPPPKKMSPEESRADFIKQHSVVRGESLASVLKDGIDAERSADEQRGRVLAGRSRRK